MKTCTYIRPLPTSELEVLAAARFAHLRKQTADGGARRELAEAGVSAARIEALYPFDPFELRGYVSEALSGSSFATITSLDAPFLTESASAGKQLLNSFSGRVLERVTATHSSERAKAATRTVQPQVAELLPMAEPTKRAVAAATIIGNFWYSLSGMIELEEIAPPSRTLSPKRRIVLEAFLRSTDLVLPHLRQNELNEVALDEWLENREALS